MLTVENDFLQILGSVFSVGWRIATSFNIPGTNINVVEFALACLVLRFVLVHVCPAIGIHVDPAPEPLPPLGAAPGTLRLGAPRYGGATGYGPAGKNSFAFRK